MRFASLILGLAEIEGDSFLLFVETVYLQAPFPPSHVGIYQIASIDYLQYSRVITNREVEIINTMKRVRGGRLRKSSISASTSRSSATSRCPSRSSGAGCA